MTLPVTGFFAPRIHRLDHAVLKLTKGRRSISGILGWNIIQLTTIGAKTGRARTLPLLALFDGEKIGVVASHFGRAHHPGWYYNLKAHPECVAQWRGKKGKYVAHEAEGNEYEKYWRLALSYYEGYAKYKERAAPRRIPVMALEPKK